jgi:hypothetical protein
LGGSYYYVGEGWDFYKLPKCTIYYYLTLGVELPFLALYVASSTVFKYLPNSAFLFIIFMLCLHMGEGVMGGTFS